jgi:Glycosyl transferase family 2
MPEETPVTTELEPIELPILPDEPLVSVLVSNYNYGRFVGHALESALHQTYERIEIVVCDDGSTDDSCSVIERIAGEDSRLTLIRKSNGGQASAFNATFREARGDIICFLDADDIFDSGKVERCVDAFAVTNAGLLVHQMMIVDEDGRRVQRIPTFTRFEQGWIGGRLIARGGRWRWGPTSAVAIRHEVGRHVFPMPERDFRTDADTFLLMLAPLLTSVCGVEEVLGVYRLHGSNAFGQKGVDRRAVGRTTRALTVGLQAVNERLIEMGWEGVRLDADQNLKLREQAFLAAALDGKEPRRQLLREYRRLVPALRRDDLYDAYQKVWAVILFGMCLCLPRKLRSSWISFNLGTSRAKELIRRVKDHEWLGRQTR